MRTSPLLNWARLLRAPNLLTAPGDALGGLFLLATAAARPVHAPALLLVSLASVAAYAFGILTNDLFDLEEDRRCRPERPLPSGAIGTRAALLAALALALASLALAWLIAPPALLADAALLACILLYNGLAKRRRLPGALAMGLCRGLNVLLGAACVLPPVIGAHIRTLIPWQLSWILLGNSLHAAVAAVALLLAWWIARRLARHLPQS